MLHHDLNEQRGAYASHRFKRNLILNACAAGNDDKESIIKLLTATPGMSHTTPTPRPLPPKYPR
eukprot:scaffold1836_cov204-Alexandrium_tamarense.AAC.35